MSPQILTERINKIGLITLNRPEKLNALTMEMYDGLDSHLLLVLKHLSLSFPLLPIGLGRLS